MDFQPDEVKYFLRIVQLATHFYTHDAIGNEIMAMDDALRQAGYDTVIMAGKVHEELRHRAKTMDLSAIAKDDLVLFHKSAGDMITGKIAALLCKKVMIYHNITPAKYYFPYNQYQVCALSFGCHQVSRYAPRMDVCWADSVYNANDLINKGVPKEKISILPILFSEYANRIEPDPVTAQKLKSVHGAKLLAVGRIVPNKKLEDVIKAYTVYRVEKDPDAVLFLVGGWDNQERYYAKLKGFAAELNLGEDQVVFTGNITDEEKEAYYRNTDVLICLSEHEGFCVPLLEASARDLPILAYKAAAIPETLDGSGLQFEDKDYNAMANALHKLRTESAFRDKTIEGQRVNLKSFDPERIRGEFLQLVKEVTGESSPGCMGHGNQQRIGQRALASGNHAEAYVTKWLGAQRKEMKEGSFKPLWRIHNATYRNLSRGLTRHMIDRTISRVIDAVK